MAPQDNDLEVHGTIINDVMGKASENDAEDHIHTGDNNTIDNTNDDVTPPFSLLEMDTCLLKIWLFMPNVFNFHLE